jgi:hypothetical protein
MFQRVAVSIFIIVMAAMIGVSVIFKPDNKTSVSGQLTVSDSYHKKSYEESRYVQMFTDTENGCQYMTTMDGGITPRLNPNGTQVCDRKAATEITLQNSGVNF